MRALAVLLPVPLLLLAGAAGELLDGAREEAGVPISAARVPLGGFEPIAVNVLWLRVETLRAERRLPEALSATRLITELQPRVGRAWAYQGYLLAWRTSESAANPDEDWRWVRQALRILERGHRLNPDSPAILSTAGDLLLFRVAARPALAARYEAETGFPPEKGALESYRALLRVVPSAINLTRFAETARLLGERLEARGEAAGAVAAYREAVAAWQGLRKDDEPEVTKRRIAEFRARIERLSGR